MLLCSHAENICDGLPKMPENMYAVYELIMQDQKETDIPWQHIV